METESKYLKQIRDELKKKNGETGHSLYNDSNAKAKYLRDIAKEIHKFDSGKKSNDILRINIVYDPELAGHQITDITYADFNNAWLNNKVIILKTGYNFLQYNGRVVKNGHTYVEFLDSADVDDDNTENTTLVLKKTKWTVDFDNSNEDGVGEISATTYTYTCTVDDIQVSKNG